MDRLNVLVISRNGEQLKKKPKIKEKENGETMKIDEIYLKNDDKQIN
jgi:hypothetical protein